MYIRQALQNLWQPLSNPTVRWYLLISSIIRFSMNVTGSTYAIFLKEKGFDPLHINLVNLVFYVVMLIFEVPTGALADTWGRKNCVVAACLLAGVGLYWYATSTTFVSCATAEGLLALGGTLYSGAFNAWLYDTLKQKGSEQLAQPTFSLAYTIGHLTGVSAGVVGGYTATTDRAIPFYVGSAMSFVGVLLAFLVMREAKHKVRRFSRLWRTLCLGVRYTLSHRTISTLVLMGLMFSVAVQAPNMQWQPTFESRVGGTAGLGWLMAVMFFFLMLGSSFAARRAGSHPLRVIFVCMVCVGVGILATRLFDPLWIALIFFLGHEVFRGVIDPAKATYLNREIRSSRLRATVISCDALGRDAGGVIGLPVWGAVTVVSSMTSAWVWAGVFLILTSVILYRFR